MKRILLFTLMMGTVPLQAAQEDENDSYIQISKTVLAVGAIALPIAGYYGTQLVQGVRDFLFLRAIEGRNYRHVKFFLEVAGSDPNHLFFPSYLTINQSQSLHTQGWPLHIAVTTGLPEMVTLLLNHGAHDCFDANGRSVLHKAAAPYNPALFLALLEGYKQPEKNPNGYSDHCRSQISGLYQHALANLYEKATKDSKLQKEGKRFTSLTLPKLIWK